MRTSETRPERPAHAATYAELHAFCLFIGYPKSGHSLVGALLDAHPDVVIARAVNPLALVVVDGRSPDEVFQVLLDNARAESARGRKQNRYRYTVDGQWQGRVRTLRVLGDKFSDRTTKRVGRTPGALASFERQVGVPLRLIHVVRNPFDMVARIAKSKLREGSDEEKRAKATEYVGRLAAINDDVIASDDHPVLTIRHESVVEDAQRELTTMCEFLEVEPEPDYLAACAGLVFESPQRTRDLLEWTDDQIAAVDTLVASHAFFAGYTFET
ncbi:MAG TPA: hypothetical protein VFA24_08325 [Gaiellaceae bacterium]|nr:hypothetical protein [Gaiellaceae bacterium]